MPLCSSNKSCPISLCNKLLPLTAPNLAFYYFPIFGAANYGVLSVNVTNPRLLLRIIPSRDITNVLLGSSILGCGLYIYNRIHLKETSPQMRVLYSSYESFLFNFGSVLLWAVFRKTIRNNCLNTVAGLLSGFGLIYIGHKYLKFIDDHHTTRTSDVK